MNTPLSLAPPQWLAPASQLTAASWQKPSTLTLEPGGRGCPANGFYPRDASVNDVFQNLWVDFTTKKYTGMSLQYNTESFSDTETRRH